MMDVCDVSSGNDKRRSEVSPRSPQIVQEPGTLFRSPDHKTVNSNHTHVPQCHCSCPFDSCFFSFSP